MKAAWRRRFIRQFTLCGVLVLLIAYVASDAIRGPHGLVAKERLLAKMAGLQKELDTLKAQRSRLEHDAELLGPKAAEQPALLDEQARSLLDFANPTDIVVINDASANP